MIGGELDTHVQPEVFFSDPKKGLAGLRKILQLEKTPRTRSRVLDIAHLGGTGNHKASLVKFIDGLPFHKSRVGQGEAVVIY